MTLFIETKTFRCPLTGRQLWRARAANCIREWLGDGIGENEREAVAACRLKYAAQGWKRFHVTNH